MIETYQSFKIIHSNSIKMKKQAHPNEKFLFINMKIPGSSVILFKK